MSVKTNIKDFYGRVIGTVVEENNGDKTIKDFYGRPLGYYKKGRNVTTDFYGRVVASGDQLTIGPYSTSPTHEDGPRPGSPPSP